MNSSFYTARHPESQQRLRNVYEGILSANEEAAYSALLGAAAKGKASVSRAIAAHSAFAMVTVLQLEAKFDPNLRGDVLKKVAAKLGVWGYTSSQLEVFRSASRW